MRISSSFLRKYSSGLFFISLCFVSRYRFSLFVLKLSATKIQRHKTHWGRSSLLIIILVYPEDEYDWSYLRDFGFDIQFRLLYSSCGCIFIDAKILYVVRKMPLISTRYWTVTITRSKYYGMYVLYLYTMELKCLHVNTSYSITEVFLRFNTSKSIIELYLQYKCLYSITYTDNE
jgi:hypothetical protein